MAKRVDPLKAKAAKQKKIAIGLCALLVAVLVFQVPRTLKMLKGPQPVSSTAAATTPATTPGTTTPAPAAAAGGAPVTPATGDPTLLPPTGDQPAVLVDSDQPVQAGDGQLLTFERFTSKDPFAQQAEAKPAAQPTTPPASAPTPTNEPAAPQPTTTPVAPAPSSGTGGITPAAPGTTGSPVPATPVAPPATATSISVNGAAEDVLVDGTFPAAAPVFVLVSIAKDGKSVQIGIAGGTYADGKDTIKLSLGKPLVLKNTADGSRFELLLKTVLGFATPTSATAK